MEQTPGQAQQQATQQQANSGSQPDPLASIDRSAVMPTGPGTMVADSGMIASDATSMPSPTSFTDSNGNTFYVDGNGNAQYVGLTNGTPPQPSSYPDTAPTTGGTASSGPSAVSDVTGSAIDPTDGMPAGPTLERAIRQGLIQPSDNSQYVQSLTGGAQMSASPIPTPVDNTFAMFVGGPIGGGPLAMTMALGGNEQQQNAAQDLGIGLLGVSGAVAGATPTAFTPTPPLEFDVPPGTGGFYSNLIDSPSVGPGKDYTQAQKFNIYQQNMADNGGVLRSDYDGTELVLPSKSQAGVTPPENEAQVDHMIPVNPADPNVSPGTNSYSNAMVLSRQQNRLKSNN